jgi:hypothetical protein
MLLGTLIAAAVGWALIRIYGNRNRRLLVAVPACTILIAVAIGAGLIWRVNSTLSADALIHPSYYARGAELIQLLDAAEKAGQAKDSYASKVEGALSGFAALLSNPNAGSITGDRHALLVSDLHNNTLALSSLNYYAQQQPVFFDGDFGNTGDRSEIKTLVPEIAKLGKQVIAVSGNHDSHAMMLALARSGVTVLTSHGQLLPTGLYGPSEVVVDGLRVAGFNDPLEYFGPTPDDPSRVLSFAQLPDPDQATADANRHLVGWFDALPQRPDVVMVHQNGLAQNLARTLYASGYDHPLTILTGHDHIQHVNHRRRRNRRRQRAVWRRRGLRRARRPALGSRCAGAPSRRPRPDRARVRRRTSAASSPANQLRRPRRPLSTRRGLPGPARGARHGRRWRRAARQPAEPDHGRPDSIAVTGLR